MSLTLVFCEVLQGVMCKLCLHCRVLLSVIIHFRELQPGEFFWGQHFVSIGSSYRPSLGIHHPDEKHKVKMVSKAVYASEIQGKEVLNFLFYFT